MKANETHKDADSGKEKRKGVTYSAILSTAALVISVLSFILSNFPQVNFFSRDYNAKANAGDVKSQVYLAEYYYEIGDIENCYYWTKTIGTSQNEYTSRVKNNLAFLSLTYGFQENTLVNCYDRAAALFCEAAEGGEAAALENLYLLLISYPDKIFTGINREEKLSWAAQRLYELGNTHIVQDYADHSAEWEFVQTFQSTEALAEYDGEFWNLCVGETTKKVANNFKPTITVADDYKDDYLKIYTYMQYKKRGGSTITDYKYIPLS